MNGLFLAQKEKDSLAFKKIRRGFRVTSLEDSEEFITMARENLENLPPEKFLEMLTYTGMFYKDGTLKKEFR